MYIKHKSFFIFLWLFPIGLYSFSQNYEIDDYDGQTVNTCTGTFYDSGGPAGFYGDNEDYTVTFCSDDGSYLFIDFSIFEVRSGDTLWIYDGPDSSAPLIGGYSGEGITFSITSSGTCLTFNFKSDLLFNRIGWVGNISCISCFPPVTSPIIPSDIDVCAGETINYSVDDHPGSTYDWTVFNGTPTSVSGGVHNLDVTWDLPGGISGSVKVVEINACGAKDSSIHIVDIYSLPVVSFTGLDPDYCIYDPPVTLTGIPGGGAFSGPGITGNIFDPGIANTGTHNIIYTYTDIVTGCTNQDIQVTTVHELSVTTTAHNNVTCFGADNGSIEIDVSGGTLPYSYSWTGPFGFTSTNKDISNLAPGDYNLVVTDVNLCSTSHGPITITQPTALSIDSEASTDITCNGANDGTVTVTASGGTGALVYTLNPGAVSNGTGVFTNLSANTYTVSVTDANGCGPFVSSNLTVNEPAALSIDSEVSTDITCNGANDGTVTVTASGGIGALVYTLNPGAVSNGTGVFTNLSANTYTVSVTDANGCGPVVSSNLTVNDPAALSIDSEVSTDITCNGANDGTVIVTASGGTGALVYTLSPGAVSNGTGVFTNLSANTYTVSVTDANGCGPVVTGNLVVNEPAALSIDSEASTDITCNGANDGTVTVTASGGTGALVYTLNPGAVSNGTGIFTNLSANTYTVSVTDANGCGPVVSGNMTVNEPAALLIDSETSTDITCNGSNDGTVTVTASGGTGALVYTLNPGAVSNGTGIFTNLSANTYTVSVTDANGCGPVVSGNLVVNEPAALSIDSEASTDITCNGANDGTVTVTASGGTGALVYTLNPGAVNNGTGVFTNLSANTYTVSVTDANGCGPVVSGNLVVNDPAALSIDSEVSTDITCNGANDGTVTVTASGGTGALVYTLNPGAVSNSTGVFMNLSANAYTVSVTDANGCGPVVSGNLVVNEPAALSIDSETSTDITCNGSNDGTVTVTASGGTGALVYTLNPGAVSNGTGVFTNLSADTYTVSVTDANGCGPVISGNLIVNEPAALSIDSEASTDITCNGANDGTVTVTASGGTGALVYTLNPGAVSNGTGVFTNLSANTYTVSVNDAISCGPVVSGNLVVNEPAALSIDSETSTDITCNGANDGTITIIVSGGTAPYEYSIDGGVNYFANGGNFIGLSPGNYDVSVRDVNSCSENGSTITIIEPIAISIDSEISTDITCYSANDGTITIIVSDGVAPYEYSIDGGNTYLSNGGTFTGLSAGDYDISVRDAGGCIQSGSVITISEPPMLSVSGIVTDVSVNGGNDGAIDITVSGGIAPYSYVWSTIDGSGLVPGDEDQSGLSPGAYDVTITDFNGCTTNGSYIINEPGILTIDGIVTDVSCNGANDGAINITVNGGFSPYTYSWSTSNGSGLIPNDEDQEELGPGTYDVLVTDSNSGTETASFTITEPSAIVVNVTVNSNVSCNGGNDGSASATASGGNGTISFEWSNGQTGNSVSALSAGSYSVTATDGDGCSQIESFTITEPDVLALSPDITSASCPGDFDGSIILNISGGTTPYSVTWSDGVTTEDRIGIDAGSYHVEVVDANLCTVESTIDVPYLDRRICLNIPKVFTPNGDNVNETWRIHGIELYPNAKVEIFTRWGKLVYSSKNGYDIPWDGTDKGKALPMDSYHYIIDLGDDSGQITGNVTIIK